MIKVQSTGDASSVCEIGCALVHLPCVLAMGSNPSGSSLNKHKLKDKEERGRGKDTDPGQMKFSSTLAWLSSASLTVNFIKRTWGEMLYEGLKEHTLYFLFFPSFFFLPET